MAMVFDLTSISTTTGSVEEPAPSVSRPPPSAPDGRSPGGKSSEHEPLSGTAEGAGQLGPHAASAVFTAGADGSWPAGSTHVSTTMVPVASGSSVSHSSAAGGLVSEVDTQSGPSTGPDNVLPALLLMLRLMLAPGASKRVATRVARVVHGVVVALRSPRRRTW